MQLCENNSILNALETSKQYEQTMQARTDRAEERKYYTDWLEAFISA